jgi:hypothetical protein
MLRNQIDQDYLSISVGLQGDAIPFAIAQPVIYTRFSSVGAPATTSLSSATQSASIRTPVEPSSSFKIQHGGNVHLLSVHVCRAVALTWVEDGDVDDFFARFHLLAKFVEDTRIQRSMLRQ